MESDKSTVVEREIERALAALWLPQAPRTRGPKPSFTRADIVHCAVNLADVGGVTAVSMRSVAEEVGLGVMSLYRYVPGKSELIALMVDHAYSEAPIGSVGTEGWRARLERFAWEEWHLYHRHPWLLELPLDRISPGPGATARFDAGLAAALDTGLPPVEAVALYSSVDYIVRGAARASTENAAVAPESGVAIDHWWTLQGQRLIEMMDVEQFPALKTVLDAGVFDPHQYDGDGFAEAFEAALSLLLDGVATRVARLAVPGESTRDSLGSSAGQAL